MWAFILAGIIFICSVLGAFFVGFAEGMATAPRYDNAPWTVLGIGTGLAVLVAASHWLPHLGW